jgi:hypothetical protein
MDGMKATALLLLIASSVVAADPKPAPPPKPGSEQLGRWQIVNTESDKDKTRNAILLDTVTGDTLFLCKDLEGTPHWCIMERNDKRFQTILKGMSK